MSRRLPAHAIALRSFARAILHGDEVHKEWLLQSAERFAAGEELPPMPLSTHPDDQAVDRFAAALKVKLAQKRAEGRGGWDDKSACPHDRLVMLLEGHVAKGDPIDVGAFAMMLWNRVEKTS